MKLSAVTTLFHSYPFIEEFYQRMTAEIKKITDDYEIIFVNDGSPDNSSEAILQLQETDSSVILIDLSKNFGHHKALRTGLRFAEGDYIFMIDSDLEEDPELLSLFWKQLKNSKDTDVVFAVQKTRKGSWFEKVSGKLYYILFSMLSTTKYPVNTLTARIMSRRYLEALKGFEEKEADLWGLFVLTGFKEESITVNKKDKGKSTYTLRRKIGIAIDTITTLTHKPLYLITILGLIVTIASLLNAFIVAIIYFRTGDISSQTIIIGSIWLMGGLILTALGIISIYMSKMFLEVKNRPLNIIRKIYRRSHAKSENN
ncbi:MAG TPA: glycosyltransferase family 2 protein [Chitinophagaceae bacterium]|jgi:putative glycosyltransferase|nr:glycosyltransferase family 2 protein [Chitinophagaceae bacterium]